MGTLFALEVVKILGDQLGEGDVVFQHHPIPRFGEKRKNTGGFDHGNIDDGFSPVNKARPVV